MSITMKKDAWKVKDPSTGNYRESAIFSTTLPEDAAQIVEDSTDLLEAQAAEIISDAQDAVDGIEAQKDTMIASIASVAGQGTDTTLTQSGVAADAKATGDKLTEQSEKIDETFNYAVDVEQIGIEVKGNYLKITNNVVIVDDPQTSSGGYGYVIVPCSEGDIFTVNGVSSGNYPMAWVFTDSSYNVLSKAPSNVTITDAKVVAPADSSYLIIHDKTPYRYSYKGESVDAKIEKFLTYKIGKNKFDKNACTDGYCLSDASGNLIANENYSVSDFIPVNSGEPIVISPRIRHFLFYDVNFIPDSSTWIGTEQANYVFTPSKDGYIRFTLYLAQKNSIQVEIGSTPTVYESFTKILQSDIDSFNEITLAHLEEIIGSRTSVLNGKKWVACGDSFTEGDFTGLQSSEYKYQSGKYAGENRVYPFEIGLRTDAEIVNEAISGSSIAYVDGNHYEFSKADGRYTQIPSDADYITLYFGINDSHLNVPIGTIDDNTNTTFYGAWNIVMQYLIANHPDAKIGIIISNGCDSIDYPNAEIAIAKKYGVSYLDFNSDYKVPILFRVNGKSDTSASVITANYQHYRVSADNGHPNVAMHAYESTIIQSWLESI